MFNFCFYSAGDGSVAIIPSDNSVHVCLGKREATVSRVAAEDAVRNFATFAPAEGRTVREAMVEVAIAIMHRDGMDCLPGRVLLDADGYVIPGCGLSDPQCIAVGWA